MSMHEGCSTCSRPPPAGRRRTHRLCQQQSCLRLLSDHRASLAGPAAAARHDLRRVQGLGRDDVAPLLRSLRHPIGIVAYRHLPRRADRPALARNLAQPGRRRAPGRCVAAPSRSRMHGGQRVFRQHAPEDRRPQLGRPSATGRRTMPRTIATPCASRAWTSMRPIAASGSGPSTAAHSPACPTSRCDRAGTIGPVRQRSRPGR